MPLSTLYKLLVSLYALCTLSYTLLFGTFIDLTSADQKKKKKKKKKKKRKKKHDISIQVEK